MRKRKEEQRNGKAFLHTDTEDDGLANNPPENLAVINCVPKLCQGLS